MVAQGSISHQDGLPAVTRMGQPHSTLSPRSQKSIEQIAAGLARIAIEPNLNGIYDEAVGLLSRLPAVASVILVRPDAHGLLALCFQYGHPVSERLIDSCTSALHQQWIASHAKDGDVTGPAPFALQGRDDVLLVPMVSGDALLGGFVLVGKTGIPPAVGSAERVSAAAIGTVTAQAIDNLLTRQRAAIGMSPLEHDAHQAQMRKSIGRELHDGPTQDLALAGLTLDRLVSTLGEDQAISADARQARDLIDRAVRDAQGASASCGRPSRPRASPDRCANWWRRWRRHSGPGGRLRRSVTASTWRRKSSGR